MMWKTTYLFLDGSEMLGWRYTSIESAYMVATEALTSGKNPTMIGFKVTKEVTH
nr:MAG: hypothetical protein [Bacteriophage sp.]